MMSSCEAICPKCRKEVQSHRCRLCGATRTINSVSGNVIWMLNGRVVEAFPDDKAAYIQMAVRCGIPEADWPARFKE